MEGAWDWIKSNLTDWGIAKIYITCAVIGGGMLLAQFGLSMFGFGGGEDADVSEVDVTDGDVGDAGDSLNVLSLRAIAGFLTFFGLVGWGGTSSGWSHIVTVAVALAAGGSVMIGVAWVMAMFRRLTQSGNMDPKEAIGKVATVYLRIPGQRSGKGKITVSVQGRSLEFLAVTTGEQLPTGVQCRVVSLTSDDTFEVAPLE